MISSCYQYSLMQFQILSLISQLRFPVMEERKLVDESDCRAVIANK